MFSAKSLFVIIGTFFVTFIYLSVVFAFPEHRPMLVDAYSPPHLSMPKGDVDLGIVVMDTVSDHRIAIQNTGGSVLHIKSVVPSCGCTAVIPEEKVLHPGKTTYLHVGLDASLKLGKISKTVDIYSDDPKSPHQVLTMNGYEKPDDSSICGRGDSQRIEAQPVDATVCQSQRRPVG